ncbi:hypothetical protein C3L33_05331, partial [Rhododendron williamsianum]
MSRTHRTVLHWLSLSTLLLLQIFPLSHGDVGTVAQYGPPYTPAGDGIWDNGAACGRQYLVKCISATTPYTCVLTGQFRSDRRFRSDPGFSTFIWWYHHGFDGDGARNHCNSSAPSINIEFQQ